MTTPATPSHKTPAGDDRNLVAVDATTALTFEDKLHVFWGKNRNAIFVVCVLVVVAIVANGGWEYLARQRELDIGKAYDSGSGTLARLTLEAVGEGLSPLELPQIDFNGDGAPDLGPTLSAVTFNQL